MHINPVFPFAILVAAGLFLFVGALLARRNGLLKGRTALVALVTAMAVIAGVAWLWPALPWVDRSIDEGLPLVDPKSATVQTGPASFVTDAPSTQEYLRQAAASDLFEIQAGEIGRMRGQTSQVRDFGKEMARQHDFTRRQLVRIAKDAGVSIPSFGTLTSQQQDMIGALQTVPDNRFNSVFLGQQIEAHQKALNLDLGYGGHGEDPALRAVATAFSKKIRSHLLEAQSLYRSDISVE